MSASVSEGRRYRATASSAPALSARFSRMTSIAASPPAYARKGMEREAPLEASPSSATVQRGTSNGLSSGGAHRSGAASSTAASLSPLLPHASQMARSASLTGNGARSTGVRLESTHERTATAPLQRTKSVSFAEKRCKYVVGTMRHCGSIYEEMAKQLVASGRWSHLSIRQRSITKTLFVSETQRDLSDTNVHLLLGEKMPCERVVACRRVMAKRCHFRVGDGAGARNTAYGPRPYTSTGLRMPMGNGNDGEPRVVNFVENTRTVTLKSSMVTVLLKYHNYNWGTLGDYLPMSFKLTPRQSTRDERQLLLATTKSRARLPKEAAGPCMWIAKSSAGCHGDNIEIFNGDSQGVVKLLNFIDNQRENHAWIAQQYVDRPLLYHKRKFDIRCWALLLRDRYEIFVHEELVMRMSSVPYSRESATSKTPAGRLAHITNHCVQETSKTYSLYEESNELWREHLDGLVRYKGMAKASQLKQGRYLPGRSPRPEEPSGGGGGGGAGPSSTSPSREPGESPYPVREVHRGDSAPAPRPLSPRDTTAAITLDNYIMPQVHFIVRDTLLAVRAHVPDEPTVPPTHTFQVFGYDFLIDENLKVWLLEINGAPGGPDRLKPAIMRDTIELAVAPYYPGTMNLKARRHNGYVRVHP
ncbi:tubulin-tyrosine ligase-like protein [Novymonas esmeraldas]|uniref:Tubulin--tyrosine ligase n=1 Tax=Novymonas esmeraldas TaxID=1808958 RepID=A0AAW0FCI0_9TRYP